jgi:MYXO-CTERM domain-containing protein
MAHAGYGLSLTTLKDGSVLESGDSAFAQRYSPTTGRWTEAGTQSAPRLFASAVRLAGGQVMVAGGISGDANGSVNGSTVTTTDIYDPSTNSWGAAAALRSPTAGAAAALLPGGGVLLAGGGVGHDRTSARTDTEIWNVAGLENAPVGGTLTPYNLSGSSDPSPWWFVGAGAAALLLLIGLFAIRRRQVAP